MKQITWNKVVYGESKFTATEIIEKLTAEKCFNNKTLVIWPDWFKAAEMFTALNAKVLISKGHGRGTYGDSSLHLA